MVAPSSGKVTIAGDWLPDEGVCVQQPALCKGICEVYMGKQSAVKGLLESLERHCAWAMSRRRASSFAETEYFSAESEASGSESFTMETLPVTRADKLNLPTIASGCELAASAQNVPLESRRTAGDEELRIPRSTIRETDSGC